MEIELGEVQERFAKLLWERVPVTSGELVKICEQEFGWKKPTTYTVLRKLCEKGLFQNEGGTVTALVSEEELQKRREKLKPFEPKVKSGYLYKYAKNVQDASHGAIV